jgi:hypothetical protein
LPTMVIILSLENCAFVRFVNLVKIGRHHTVI